MSFLIMDFHANVKKKMKMKMEMEIRIGKCK
jgi:hypothetical protein